MKKEDWNKYYKLILGGKIKEAEELRIKSIPTRLIKFVALNGDKDDEKKLMSLSENKLWISPVSMMNDPYEFKTLYLGEDKIREKGWTEEVINELKKLLEFKKFGISCLSANEVSYLPMWAYYTNNYKGYCIEYELKNKKKIKGNIAEVNYSDERVEIASILLNLPQMSENEKEKIMYGIIQSLFIKHISWEHEKECRIVLPITNECGENVDISELNLEVKKIVVGIKCSEYNQKKLNRISNKLGCGNAYRLCLSDKEYKLIEERMD